MMIDGDKRGADDISQVEVARNMFARRRPIGALVASVLLGVGICLGLAAPAGATPAGSPAGANEPSCVLTPEHPRPVVLVHGTWADMGTTWKTLAPTLEDAGYCVYALNYGAGVPGSGQNLLDLVGGDSVVRSAQTLAGFVTRVREQTGAEQVDLIGHSQGALVAREYLKNAGGTDLDNPAHNAVHSLISLAGTNQGTSFHLNQGLGAIAQALGIPVIRLFDIAVGPSYVEQMAGSPFLNNLNAGGDTRPGVNYVAIATRDDMMVTPAENAFLIPSPGDAVRNVWVQDGCAAAHVDHMQVTSSPRAVWLTLDALDPGYRATHPAPCP
jgi:triacylglycerol esterase/lipase EstA (alpha/beta hydrolase family)